MEEKIINEKLSEIERRLGFNFRDRSLLRQAFVHGSYVNEAKPERVESYQRLEFLGDAVLGLAIGEYYYRSREVREGGLTELRKARVNRATLAEAAARFGLGEGLILGHGEEPKGRKKQRLLADCLEAVVGAAFLDSGYEKAAALAVKLLIE